MSPKDSRTRLLAPFAAFTLTVAAGAWGTDCSSSAGGVPDGGTYPPDTSFYNDVRGDDSGASDAGDDIVLPDAPPGFFDVSDIPDSGLNLESGFDLDAADTGSDAGDDAGDDAAEDAGDDADTGF